MWRLVYFNLLCFSGCLLITACNAPEQPKSDLELCPDAKIGNYTLVTQLDGELTASDCTREGTFPIDYYKFSVAQQTVVTFYLQTNGADFGVRLFDTNQQELALVPADQYPRKYKRQLLAGDYTFAIQTNTDQIGKYTLTTSTLEQGFSGCPILTKLELGTKVEGEVTPSDCVGGSDYVDYYEFSLPQQDAIAICGGAGRSLFLRDGTVLESDIIVRAGCAFRDLQPGNYVIAEYARGQQRPSPYSLSITTTFQGFLFCYDVKTLAFDVTQQGTIETIDCTWPPFPYGCTLACGDDYGYADYYGFEVNEQRELEINYAFSGEHPSWRVFDRRTGYSVVFGNSSSSLVFKPGSYVIVVGYNAPDLSNELGLYSLAVNLK